MAFIGYSWVKTCSISGRSQFCIIHFGISLVFGLWFGSSSISRFWLGRTGTGACIWYNCLISCMHHSQLISSFCNRYTMAIFWHRTCTTLNCRIFCNYILIVGWCRCFRGWEYPGSICCNPGTCMFGIGRSRPMGCFRISFRTFHMAIPVEFLRYWLLNGPRTKLDCIIISSFL